MATSGVPNRVPCRPIDPQGFIDQGALVAILSDWSGESFPLDALYPSRHLPAAKVRAFIDFVQSRVARPGTAATGLSSR